MSYPGGIPTRLDTIWSRTILGADGHPIERSIDLEGTWARSRRLEDNNNIAGGILDRVGENVIGTGIRLRSLSKSTVFRDKVNDKLKELLTGNRLDVRRDWPWDSMQRLFYRARDRDGDCLLVFIDRGFGPEVQLIEADCIESPPRNLGGAVIRNGIEYDAIGAPVAYWVRHYATRGMIEHRRIAARDAIFWRRSTRYNGGRGLTGFHGAYTLLDQILGLLDAAVVSLRVAASQALIVRTKRPREQRPGGGTRSLTIDAHGRPIETRIIEPGQINFIWDDEEISTFSPQYPGLNLADTVRTFCRFLGLRFGLTIERVLLDFSGANYSVSRSTALQERRTAEVEQWEMNNVLFCRLYPWLVRKLIKRGELAGPVPDDWGLYEWTPNGRPLVEPSKDAPGLKILADMGVVIEPNIAAEMGYDADELIRDQAEWKKKRLAADLPFGNGVPPLDPVPVDPDENDGEDPSAREEADAYGIAVRSGAVTPQAEDEAHFRQRMGLPPMGDGVREAWNRETVRRPITLADSDSQANPQPPPVIEE